MNELLERLRQDLSTEENRYAYADAMTNAFVSAQIKALKEDRKLTQGELAEIIGTQQSAVSRLLRSDYSSWSVDTLRKLARAFGVRLVIRYEEFGTLLSDVSGFTRKALVPRKFEDDPVLKGAHSQRIKMRRSGRSSRPRRNNNTSMPSRLPKKAVSRADTHDNPWYGSLDSNHAANRGEVGANQISGLRG